jgi:hypothetical protein
MSAAPPLFILAPPHHRAPEVWAMLGRHPELAPVPETNLLAAAIVSELDRFRTTQPQFLAGLLRAVAQYGFPGPGVAATEAAQRWLDERQSAPTAEVLRELREWCAPKAMVERITTLVSIPGGLERMAKAAPDARYLHLGRHPRGACESWAEAARRSGRGPSAQVTAATLWLKPHLRVLEFLERVSMDRKMFLRVEALLDEPEVYLPQIAEWLGVSRTPEVLEALRRPGLPAPVPSGVPTARPVAVPPPGSHETLRAAAESENGLEAPLSWGVPLGADEVLRVYATQFGYSDPSTMRRPPLVVLCPHPALATAVADLLGRHPEIVSLRALHLFSASTVADLLARYRSRAVDLGPLLRALARLGPGGQSNESLHWLEERVQWTTAQVLEHLLSRTGGRIAVDASWTTVSSVDTLKRALASAPQARFLHVAHHPDCAVVPVSASTRSPGAGRLGSDEWWLGAHNASVEFGDTLRLGQYMRLRAEDLLAAPASYLPQISAWLGLAADARTIDTMLTAGVPVRMGPSPSPRAFQKPVTKLMRMLGYA